MTDWTTVSVTESEKQAIDQAYPDNTDMRKVEFLGTLAKDYADDLDPVHSRNEELEHIRTQLEMLSDSISELSNDAQATHSDTGNVDTEKIVERLSNRTEAIFDSRFSDLRTQLPADIAAELR
jgi:hypothetical protein